MDTRTESVSVLWFFRATFLVGMTNFSLWIWFSLAISSGSMKGFSSKHSKSSTLNISAPIWKKHTVADGNSDWTKTSLYPPSMAIMCRIGFLGKGLKGIHWAPFNEISLECFGSSHFARNSWTAESLITWPCEARLAYSHGRLPLLLVYPINSILKSILRETINLDGHNKRIRISLHAYESFIAISTESHKAICEVSEIIIFFYFSCLVFVVQMGYKPVLRVSI